MNKYGIDHFRIELLEETESPEERECFWIEQKGSFENGYDDTMGGNGKKYIDYDLVVATYEEVKIMRRVSEILGISEDSVSRILKIREIPTLNASQAQALASGKIVNQYDLQNNLIQSFPSSKAAADALGKTTLSSNGASSHITDVCIGKRKSAYGFIWRFVE
jgi:hypothetical protein